jgi:uncharacterized protein HemY
MSESSVPGSRRHILGRPARAGLAGLALAATLVAGLGLRGTGAADLRREAREALAEGRLTDATAALARLDRAADFEAPDHLLAARVAAERCEYDEALLHLGEIRPPHPLHTDARLLAAQVKMDRDQLAVAERDLWQALANDPGRPQIRRLILAIHELQGRDTLVIEDLRELSRADILSARELLTWTRARLGLPAPASDQRLDRLADAKLADPIDLWSSIALADQLRRAGRLEEASRAVAELADQVAPVWASRSRIELDAGRPDQAAKFLARTSQDHPEVARLQAQLALGRGDAAGALVYLDVVDVAQSGRLDVALMRAEALAALGRADEAARARAEADRLAVVADRVSALLNGRAAPGAAAVHELARACLDLGENHLAREWYRRLAADSPGHPEALEALGRLDLELAPEFASAFEPPGSAELNPVPSVALRGLDLGRSG